VSELELPDGRLADRPLPTAADVPLPGMRSTALPVRVRRARRERYETLLVFALDAAAIVLGFLLAYWVRYELGLGFGRETTDSPLSRFGSAIGLTLGTTLALLWLRGSYQQPRNVSWLGQLGTLASSVTTAIGLMIIITFLVRRIPLPSRLIVLYAAVLIFALLALSRLLIGSWRRWRWRRGYDLDRVLVVGGTGLGREVMASLNDSGATGYELVGYLADPPDPDAPPPRYTGSPEAPHLGALDALPQQVAQQQVDHVIIALPFWQHRALPSVVQMCRRLGIDYDVVPDFYELSFDRVTTQEIRGTPLIRLRENQIKGANYLLKRVLDVTLILGTLPLWGPLALVIAILVKLTSRGPIIYRQTRIGRHGDPFEFLKFRTMVVNADDLKAELMQQNEGSGPMFKMKDDPRVTPLGRFLRKYSLDEIPQFWNILRGEMSLVGPRPAIPEEVEKYEPWHMRRLEVTPGATGLWQVTGRSDSSFDQYVKLDIYYAEHWSLWLDLRILLATIPAVLLGRGAY
jgi:exopolysaccharide biosynthesis polyprenyl glycosylphosphotransferase